MIVALILVVCLAGQPDTCKEVRAPADVTLEQCRVYAQPIAAEMLRDMPKYVLRGWRCKIGERPERKA